MAADYFLKIDGVKGESHDSKHKDEIEITSFSWGATQTGSFAQGGGGGAGKVKMEDFNFQMFNNKASPLLMLKCATGEHIKSAILTVRKAGKDQQEYLKITFSDLLISSFKTNGAGGDEPNPTDEISFNYAKIQIVYKEQNADGTLGDAVDKTFDVKTMKAA